jgi:hypothetical protein
MKTQEGRQCFTCQRSGATLVISATPLTHDHACTGCWSDWDGHAKRVSAARPSDMQRPSFALAEYRRWQAWRRATLGRNTVPRVACL